MPQGMLSRVPAEVFDMILWQLDLTSIYNLRRTSTAIASDCLSPGYKRFFAHKTTSFEPNSMREALELAAHPALGPALKNLKLLTVFYDESRWAWAVRQTMRQIQEVWRLQELNEPNREFIEGLFGALQRQIWQVVNLRRLRWECLTFMRQLGSQGFSRLFARPRALRALTLDTLTHSKVPGSEDILPYLIPEGMDWQGLWYLCKKSLRLVALMGLRSDINIETLSMFDSQGDMLRGMVRSADLQYFAEDFLNVVSSSPRYLRCPLKNLTLVFSTYTETRAMVDSPNLLDPNASDMHFLCDLSDAHIGPQVARPEDLDGVVNFLRLMPALESLDLRLFNTLRGAPWLYCDVLSKIASVPLPELKHLTLRGFWTTGNGLGALLRAHPNLETLNLHEIHLAHYGFRSAPILPQIAPRPMGLVMDQNQHAVELPLLRQLHLETLFTGFYGNHGFLMILSPPGWYKTDSRRFEGAISAGRIKLLQERRSDLVYARVYGQEDITEGRVLMSWGSGLAVDSDVMLEWNRTRRRLYGPPSTHEQETAAWSMRRYSLPR